MADLLSRRNLFAVTARVATATSPALSCLSGIALGDQSTRHWRSCILVYCWGGMSHHETWDPKPNASVEVRGEFDTIATATPGIQIGEHLPLLARQTDKLAIVRSLHHEEAFHGRGMYWNLTGHKPPGEGNLAPSSSDWPSFPAMVAKQRTPRPGVPSAVRVPYPMVDNGTLQAGEYGGWLGARYSPIVMRTPRGEPFAGVSRTLGSQVLDLGEVDVDRLVKRNILRKQLERNVSAAADFDEFHHFRALAKDMLLSSAIKDAYDLDKEDSKVRDSYGPHIGGQSMLLARRLVEAGVPIVQVCCAAGDLNGGQGDMWDTHTDNFNRLKNRLLPVFDRGFSVLLEDLSQRGMLDDTLVVMLTEFGRTPRINSSAGRDHFPDVYSIVLAGGGIRGGQVYGSSDKHGVMPNSDACQPADIHATMFRCLGIPPRTEIRDALGRPFPMTEGNVLPLF